MGKPGGGTIISLQDVAVTYDDERMNRHLRMWRCHGCSVSYFAKWLGKTTLCKVFLGAIEASESRGTVARTGYFIYFPQTALGDLLKHHRNERDIDY